MIYVLTESPVREPMRRRVLSRHSSLAEARDALRAWQRATSLTTDDMRCEASCGEGVSLIAARAGATWGENAAHIIARCGKAKV